MSARTALPSWLTKPASVSPALPGWVKTYRQKQWNTFLEMGLPTRKNERWKYTDLSILNQQSFVNEAIEEEINYATVIAKHRVSADAIVLVMINGFFSMQHSEINKLPGSVIVCDLETAMMQHSPLVQQYWETSRSWQAYPFATMNAATFINGMFMYVPADVEVKKPIQLLSIVSSSNCFMANPRHLIAVDKNATLTLLEESIALSPSPYLMNVVTQVNLSDNAKIEYVKLQTESKQAIHLAHLFLEQDRNSNASLMNFSLGGQFARDELIVHLNAQGAACQAGGLYCVTEDAQYVDHHIDIIHQAPHTQSEMTYKGVLDNASKAVFNGRLLVEKDAQKIIAYQANHNLLLSNTAEVYSKPELEIYADDVKCKHGATTGQLDEEALFYFRSRGIPFKEARQMLLKGFAAEIIERIGQQDIQHKVEGQVQEYL